jgi:hypothetical protein
MSVKKTKISDIVIPTIPKEPEKDMSDIEEKILKKVNKATKKINDVLTEYDVNYNDVIIKNIDEYRIIKKFRDDYEKDNKKKSEKIYRNIVGKKIFSF